jgi:two-component system nitrogen regulation sensor histidine kinase NtrY
MGLDSAMLSTRQRFVLLFLGIVALVFTSWFELFVQKKHYLIGGGISRGFLFLLINAHLVVIIVLLYLIIRHSIKLFLERRKGVPGSVFKRNLLFAFILFSVIPSFFVFFTAGKFITQSIDRWFQYQLGAGFLSAVELHQQHTQVLRDCMMRDGQKISKALHAVSPDRFESVVKSAGLESYAVYAFKQNGYPLLGNLLQDEVCAWRKFRTFNDRTTKRLRRCFLLELAQAIKEGACFDFYGSLYWGKMCGDQIYVLVYRYPQRVRQALIGLYNALEDYNHLRTMRNSIYWSYFVTFLLIAILILFLAIWCAFYLAKGISKPIQELLDAIEKVRHGHWDTQVTVDPSSDLHTLARGFNEMTGAVRQAHAHLELKNNEMVAILESISAAVFLIDKHGRIIFSNNAARSLVNRYVGPISFVGKKVYVFGKPVKDTFFSLLNELYKSQKENFTKELTFTYAQEPRTFVIYGRRLMQAQDGVVSLDGLLVVIDDITDMVKINKIKTWQEAAKQMAHEIKNPLTPIQLATQRMQRRFKDVLSADPIFLNCTDTILQQVNIIKDLVSHFSYFAAMPAVLIEPVNISDLVQEVLCLYQVSYPDIAFIFTSVTPQLIIKTDRRKMKLVLINLFDNSVRALGKSSTQDKEIAINVSVDASSGSLRLLFSDNGPGISSSVKETLFLPYVSTEKKNMGLGLAIVHDIITQLGGSVSLLPSECGATFSIVLPL